MRAASFPSFWEWGGMQAGNWLSHLAGGLAWLTSWSGLKSNPESQQAINSITLLPGAVKELGWISPFSFRNGRLQPFSLLRAGPWSHKPHYTWQTQFRIFAGGKFGRCKSKGDSIDHTGKVLIILHGDKPNTNLFFMAGKLIFNFVFKGFWKRLQAVGDFRKRRCSLPSYW